MDSLMLFSFHEQKVRTHVDAESIPWFCAKDVCGILELSNHKKAINSLKAEWKHGVIISDPIGRKQFATFINESGVYKIAFRSRKPKAEEFTDWIAEKVLPSIRKTGRFDLFENSLDDINTIIIPKDELIELQRAMISELKREQASNQDRDIEAPDYIFERKPRSDKGKPRKYEEEILRLWNLWNIHPYLSIKELLDKSQFPSRATGYRHVSYWKRMAEDGKN